jgi:hypothetical protein
LGDVLTDSYTSASFANRNVGTGKAVSVNGISISGTDAGNYSLGNTAASTSADITKRTLTITAATNTKIYDTNTSAAATPTTSGLQGTDTVTGLSETYDTSSVGTGKTLSVATSYTVNDANGGNNYAASMVANHTGIITFATTGTCYGGPGHTILQPINTDRTSVWKGRQVVPVKFRVCDVNGNSIGGSISAVFDTSYSGGVAAPVLYLISSDVQPPDETAESNTPDPQFRWDSSAQQWIFNLNTNSLAIGKTYYYYIYLADGSKVDFAFGLK